MRKQRLLKAVVIWAALVGSGLAQTTGKIAGTVKDAETGEPLPGAQVMVTAKWEGDRPVKLSRILGAAAGEDGRFFILNVPPGRYTIQVQMIGYQTLVLKKARVHVNRTLEIHARLKPSVIQGKAVVVTAEEIQLRKDQTSSVRNVSADKISKLPVESIGQVVALQPGVVVGHFRGGRSGEVSYLIDGIDVTESFSHSGRTVDVSPEAVQEVEVITGTFNAEYGRAMSGVVNIVTKEGGERFNFTGLINYGNYLTPHKDIFIGLKDLDIRTKDYRFTFSGPLFGGITFFANLRYQDNLGHLNGIYRFRPDDYSDFHGDSTQWISEHHGTGEIVPMSWGKDLNVFSNLTYRLSGRLKLSLLTTINRGEGQGYDHFFKYNPYGRATAHSHSSMLAFLVNHVLSNRMFYELKLSYTDAYNGNYVYKNPYDRRYVSDQYFRSYGPGFATGGQQKHHVERFLKDANAKFDLTWQVTQSHNIKTGFQYTNHNVRNESFVIRNKYYGTGLDVVMVYDSTRQKIIFPYYEPVVMPDSSIYTDMYSVQPWELSAYIQDKMEFDRMVVNLGVRLDYFDPNTTYPSQWRNPANQLRFPNNPEKMSRPLRADPKYQISPRLGVSYQLGKTALLHFAYGHFFQMPPLYAMYQNHSHFVPPSDFSTVMGNPQVHAQKTVQYEVGLWQKLADNMDLEVTVYYRDIYDLLSAKVITTYNQIRYGLYSNKDYGNVRGLELRYNLNLRQVYVSANYTFQYTRGNADSPTFTFSRAGARMDPVNRMIPMSWDQRHTLNVSVGYHRPRYGATIMLLYNSGTPYTWSPLPESPLTQMNLFPNNDYKPSTVRVDFTGTWRLGKVFGADARLKLLVYNLLDRLNEVSVYSSTGRAYTALVRETDIKNHKSNFNDFWDRIHNPAMFSAPRLVKLGLEVAF